MSNEFTLKKADLNKEQLQALKLAKQITRPEYQLNFEERRAAFCMALYLAGASILIFSQPYARLRSSLCALLNNCKEEIQPALNWLLSKVDHKQDFDYSDSPLACLFAPVKGGFEAFPSAEKISGDDKRTILTRCFIHSISAESVLPRIEISSDCPKCGGALSNGPFHQDICLECSNEFVTRCPACFQRTIDCHCQPDKWE
jgi:hypothetical protein